MRMGAVHDPADDAENSVKLDPGLRRVISHGTVRRSIVIESNKGGTTYHLIVDQTDVLNPMHA